MLFLYLQEKHVVKYLVIKKCYMQTGLAPVTVLTVFIMVVGMSTFAIEDTDQQRVQILR